MFQKLLHHIYENEKRIKEIFLVHKISIFEVQEVVGKSLNNKSHKKKTKSLDNNHWVSSEDSSCYTNRKTLLCGGVVGWGLPGGGGLCAGFDVPTNFASV